MALAGASLDEASRRLEELFAGLEERAGGRIGAGQTSHEAALDMRYEGQEHTITVTVAWGQGQIVASLQDVRNAFTLEYDRVFGHTMDEGVEIVSLRATLRTPLPRRAVETRARRETNEPSSLRTTTAFSFTAGDWLTFHVVDRSTLKVDEVVEGSAILMEETATTCLDAGFTASVDPSGVLSISRRVGGL